MSMSSAWKVPRNFETVPRAKNESVAFLDKAGEIRYKSAGIDWNAESTADASRLLAVK